MDGVLGVGDGPAFAARYVPRLPERQPLTAAALDDGLGPLEPSDFEDGFVLLVEARAPLAERVRLGPTVRFDPEWRGLGRLRVPIVVEDATDVDPALLDDADRVVRTLLARYRARRLPRSVTVSLHDAATGGRLDAIEARRTT